MAYAQSLYNQSSGLKINVMVVDDDSVFLQVTSRRLEKSKYRGKCLINYYMFLSRNFFFFLYTSFQQEKELAY